MAKENSLLDYFDLRLNGGLALLRRLVEAESPTGDRPGVDRIAGMVSEELAAWGAEVELIPTDRNGSAVRALYRSRREGTRPVMLLGHLDTVWPRGTIRQRPFRIENGKAYGPGVFDMKSGVLLCLLMCRAFVEKEIDPGGDVVFFFSADEETGASECLPLLKAAAEPCRAVLCLEPPLPGGRAKTRRSGNGTFRLRVTGIGAHAGIDHARGANAILELGRILVRLHALTDYARGITLNVGTIRGGSASNMVPAEAEAEVDFRFAAAADGLWLLEQIRSLGTDDPRCGLEISGGIDRPPLERTPGIAALYDRAKKEAAKLGMDLGEGSTGGGSDGSFTASLGIPTLDGLGVEGDGAHAAGEHIEIGDIPRRAALLCRLVQAIQEHTESEIK